MPLNRRSLSLLVLFAALAACLPQAWAATDSGEWKTVEDRWYSLELAGSKAGWMNQVIQTNGEQFRTDNDTNMTLNRGGIEISIRMFSSFLETADGKPISVDFKQKMSQQEMLVRWEFTPDHVEVTSRQGGNETKVQQPLPEGEWLTPAAADRYVQEKRSAGEKEISFRSIDPQNGLKPFVTTTKRTGEGKAKVADKDVDVTIWSTSTDLMPVEGIDQVDAKGTLVHQEVAMPFGTMVMQLTTKEIAKGGGEQAPELLVQTFITPDKPIENPHSATRAKLRLTLKSGKMPALPSAGAQRVEMSDDGKSAVLTNDINDNLPATKEEIANKDFLAATAMVDANDPLIQKLTKRALERSEGEKNDANDDPMKRAEALRRFVRKHISRKGMETAFASASETAKTRTGDCSEHGVLLCALLRADGIPARVATGLVYAEQFEGHTGIFGWHMWTQALIDGKWVDFDATLPERFNATHVLTSTSSLADGSLATDMSSIIQLIGNLNIDVIDVEHK